MDFLNDGSEAGALIRAYEWSLTSLGHIESWPQSLRTAVSLLVRSPVPLVLLWGTDGVMLYNDAYSVFAGGRHPKLLGSKVREGWPEVADFNDNVMRVGLGGGTLAYKDQELTLYRHGGAEQVFMDLNYSPVVDESDKPAGVICILADTTERVRAERRTDALLKLDELLRGISEPAEIAYASAKALGEALGACRVGYGDIDSMARTISVGRTWCDPGLPDVSGQHEFAHYGSYVDELLAGRAVTVADVDTDIRTSDHSDSFRTLGIRACLDAPVIEAGLAVAEVFVHSATPRQWNDAEVALALEFSERTRATIARRTAESRLRESERRYRTLFETIDQGFCIVEFIDGPYGPLSDYRHLEANPAHERHSGIADIIGKTGRSLLTAMETEEWVDLFRRVLLSGKPVRFDRELAATGRYLEVACYRVEPPERRQLAILFQDVSARKQAEQGLRELNETLERRVTERTGELMQAEEALRQAQKMEAVGQLTGGIAHDFNNLLTGLIGSLDMMQRRWSRGETDQVERYTTAAMTAANRAAALTHRLLAFSRRQPLDPKPVSVNRLVSGMEDLLRRTIGESVRLKTVTEGGLWQTLCDPHQLENAVLNLAINARDAMPTGGSLTIETCNALLDQAYAAISSDVLSGQYVCISVSDTGSGMSSDVIAKAFEPFFTTKPMGQGTGLGLSMIYGFIRQSEGHAKIYSESGQGTTVKLYLPRYMGKTTESDQPTISGPGHQAKLGEVVLVVEDETAVRDLVVEVLRDLGYGTAEAPDGIAALNLLQSDMQVDLLVTDVGLPGLNGRQLADSARVSRPRLKVLFMTGYAENAMVTHGFLEPGMMMITKPFAIEALISRIRDLVEETSGLRHQRVT